MSKRKDDPSEIRGGVVSRGVTTGPADPWQVPNLFAPCPVCQGAKTRPNSDWDDFWKEHAGDWEVALKTGHFPEEPPVLPCEQCGGTGHIYTRAGMYLAALIQETLKRLGVPIPHPFQTTADVGRAPVVEDPYPSKPPADQGPV